MKEKVRDEKKGLSGSYQGLVGHIKESGLFIVWTKGRHRKLSYSKDPD